MWPDNLAVAWWTRHFLKVKRAASRFKGPIKTSSFPIVSARALWAQIDKKEEKVLNIHRLTLIRRIWGVSQRQVYFWDKSTVCCLFHWAVSHSLPALPLAQCCTFDVKETVTQLLSASPGLVRFRSAEGLKKCAETSHPVAAADMEKWKTCCGIRIFHFFPFLGRTESWHVQVEDFHK